MKALDPAQLTAPTPRGVDQLLERAAAVRARPGFARLARLFVVAVDAVAVAGAMAAVHRLRFLLPQASTAEAAAYARTCLVALPAWLFLFGRYGLYRSRHTASRREEAGRVLHAVAAAALATAVVAFALDQAVPRSWLVALFAVAAVAVLLERELVRHGFNVVRRRGHCLRPVVIAGTGDEAVALASMLVEQPELGYRVVGLIGDPEDLDPRLVEYGPVIDGRTKLADRIRLTGATGVIVATTDVDLDTSNRLARTLTDAGLHVELSSSLKDIDAERLSVRPLGHFPVVYVEPVKRTGWPQVAKRAFDVVFSAMLLVATAPILLAAVIAVRVTSPGPAFFRQERVGHRGRRFEILKLRTMYVDADERWVDLREALDADGPVPKLERDPRVTRVGNLFRKLSIDELPQLLNVLRGQMSLVGPRPEQPAEVTLWTPEMFDRLRVRPGLTGVWQVSGRSAARHTKDRWDLYYVDNWSLTHDLGILLRTIPVVLSQKGAY